MSSTASGPPDRERSIAVGRITHAHGVRGEVSVLVLTEVEERFATGSVLHLAGGRALTVTSSRHHHGKLLVSFEELDDRTAAEPLRGEYLFVDPSQVPSPPKDAFWPHQLEGCEIVTEGGRSLGRVEEIVSSPANDIWIARDGEREILIPALRDVVLSVDIATKRIVVKDIPGLTTG
ncbi:MAG: ribosome maturation factor RimM [Actinomycetota bacterium]